MNHTQRVAHVARQRRSLTKAIVRESVERYLEALAEEIASGEWVDIPLYWQGAGDPRGGQGICDVHHRKWSARPPCR